MRVLVIEDEVRLAATLQDLLEQCRELMQEAMEELEDLSSMSELSEELMLARADGEMDPEDLEQLKKKHRAEELREIMEADMRYLKAMFDRLAKEKQQQSSGKIGRAHV